MRNICFVACMLFCLASASGKTVENYGRGLEKPGKVGRLCGGSE